MDRSRWHAFTLAQQLGNIGSELARARHGEAAGDRERRDAALARALELLDLTLDDPRRRTGCREIARLREVVCDWFAETGVYAISPEELQEYCTSFALYAAGRP
jgi:hypothetical protein